MRGAGGGLPVAGGSSEPSLPPHLIYTDEVDAWLADSMNKSVTYHRTTRGAAQDIVEQGVDITRSRLGSYGQGFYTATARVGFYGDTEVSVAIRLQHPLAGEVETVEEVVDPIVVRLSGGTGRLSPEVAVALRDELLAMGYDGIIVRVRLRIIG
jgi:hypothetical protein